MPRINLLKRVTEDDLSRPPVPSDDANEYTGLSYAAAIFGAGDWVSAGIRLLFVAPPTEVAIQGRDHEGEWDDIWTAKAADVAGEVQQQLPRYDEYRGVIRSFTPSPRPEYLESLVSAWIEG